MGNSLLNSSGDYKEKQLPGALVIGGDHPGLGVARSLGRRGVPVVVIDDQYSISTFSKYATRAIRVKELRNERRTVDTLLEVGRQYDLNGWVLFPTRDETVAAIARYREELAGFYRVPCSDWEKVQWAWDKNKSYELAQQLDIPTPKTWNPKDISELESLYPHLPLAIKPAIKENFFYATGAKAWRAETPDELNDLYKRAAKRIRQEEIMIQEIIPGDGSRQFSYCAFFHNGRSHSSLVAQRCRQHPREFGRAATYVETVESLEVEMLSERFLRAIDFYGLVEVEFKQDPRDNQYKLLDVNARAWGFHCLGAAVGVDFPYILYADQMGLPVEPKRAAPGVGWLRLITDVPTVITQMATGHLRLRDYFQSLKQTKIESVYASEDPWPSVAEVVLLPYLAAKKYIV